MQFLCTSAPILGGTDVQVERLLSETAERGQQGRQPTLANITRHTDW